MPENPQSSSPPGEPLGRVTKPVEPTAIQSTRPEPRVAPAEEEVNRAENKQAAAPLSVVAVRAGRGARRRIVVLTAAALAVLAALAGGAWWWHSRAVLRKEVTAAVTEAIRLRDSGQFRESRELLESVLTRLGANGPGDLVDRAGMALADTRLVERLDAARQKLFDYADTGVLPDFAETDREYAATLNEAVLVREGEEKDVIAARVRNSNVRAAVLAAVEDWAAVTTDEGRRAWLLAVACAADPDPDRDRLRRPELWRDGPALVRLAGERVPKSLSPGLAVALVRRALAANVRQPVPLLVEVQKLHPQDYWLNLTTGWYLNLEKKWDEAMKCHRAALATRPRAASAYYNLGTTFRRQRKLDEAVEQFEEALRLDPRSANVHNGLAASLHERGKLDEAMGHYKEALRINPKHVTALVNLGILLAEKKLLPEAISNYEAALRINPRHAGAHYHWGNALRARKELDPAIGQYLEALAIHPRYAAAHNGLGNVFYAKKQFDHAVPHYEQAIRIDPSNATYRVNLGNTLRLMRRPDEAGTWYQKALLIDRKNAHAHNGLGSVRIDKGDPDAAIPHYQEAVRLAPGNVRFRVNLGDTLSALGRHDAAIDQYTEAGRIDPKDSGAYSGLGSAYLARGKVDRAIDCCERAIRLNDKNSSAHNDLGIARLYGQGRTAEARDNFKRAAAINPRNAVLQFNVGQAWLADGRFAEGRGAVDRSLALSVTGHRYRDVFLQTRRQLDDGGRLSALAARLPDVLRGKEKPAGAAEALQFAWLCQVRLHFAEAAHFYADSFEKDPRPADDLSAGHRLNAARCSALAAAGWGRGSPKPSDAERARLRGQALGWLRADLAAWQKEVAEATPETLAAARRTLTLRLKDFRFFAVREKEELARLPDAERAAWGKLWADTEALRVRARTTRAAGQWAGLPFEGLELWLDAARLTRGQAGLKAGDAVQTWFDASGKGRHVGQAAPAARPGLVRVGQDWLVRFDGIDDHLRHTGPRRFLSACTVFVVAAAHANPGDYRAFLAANEAGRRDYQTGFNLDMGPGGSARFEYLNVEGRGFGGAHNLLTTPKPFGTLHLLEVVVAPEQRAVRLFLDGKPSGERPFAPAPLGFDEITVGARYYTNGPGPQQVRGFLQGGIAEVLVYGRTLSADETKAVRQYLDRKYARLRQALPWR